MSIRTIVRGVASLALVMALALSLFSGSTVFAQDQTATEVTEAGEEVATEAAGAADTAQDEASQAAQVVEDDEDDGFDWGLLGLLGLLGLAGLLRKPERTVVVDETPPVTRTRP